MAKEKQALIKATAIGKANTYQARMTCSTDCPADALGEVSAHAMQELWKYGEDPVDCVIVLSFSAVEAE